MKQDRKISNDETSTQISMFNNMAAASSYTHKNSFPYKAFDEEKSLNEAGPG